MPTVVIDTLPWTRSRVDVCAVFLPSASPEFHRTIAAIAAETPDLRRDLRAAQFRGKVSEILPLRSLHMRPRTLLLVGLGDGAALTAERLRRAAAAAVRRAQELKATSLAIVLPSDDVRKALAAELADSGERGRTDREHAASALLEGAILGEYRYDRWKTRKTELPPRLRRITLIVPTARDKNLVRAAVRRTAITCEGTCLARDLANAPGNELYPATLARTATAQGRKHGFRTRVLSGPGLRRAKMGGVIAVGRASIHGPRFIIMEYGRAGRRTPTVVLVGKGVTFDSGGISIKPSANMAEMKMDMSGAAAVIGTMTAAARLRIPLHLVGLVPAAENLPGGRALKPGDILTHVNGMTSEVDNTDAEGRLILADALAFAARYRPALVVDLATLTGAVVVALGHVASGMLGTDQRAMDDLQRAGRRTFERVWQLPLFEEYEKLISSDVADVKNVGGRWAGAITGAMFLKRFVGKTPWVHLDIAGTAIMEERFEYVPKGGSGVGVRLLTEFLLRRAPLREGR